MKSIKTTWLPVAAMLLSAACAVDVDETPYPPDPEPPAPECASADLVRLRILQGATGLGVIERAGKPDFNTTLLIERPDPANPGKVATTSLAFGATANATLCPGAKTLVVKTQVLKADGATLENVEVGKLDLTIEPKEPLTLIATGSVTGGATGVTLIPVKESLLGMSEAGKAKLIVVNAIPDSPATIDVDVNEAAGNDITGLAKFGVSAPISIEAPDKAATVKVLEGTTTKATFAISPRFPSGANLIAVLFDTLAPAAMSTKPKTKLFLTGNDPLIGNAPGNGIVFAAQ